MLNIFKKIFHNPDKETIDIFEKKTKIDYDPAIFSSLEVLSITNSQLNNLNPLSVFMNLKILNLSNNSIQNINCLERLKKLEIIDLRFNEIRDLPHWIFKLDKRIYWERVHEEQEGIYLEGNPLAKQLISKIKKKPIDIERLKPLQRQLVAIFSPQSFSSNFLDNFMHPKEHTTEENPFKLNISVVRYDDNHQILNAHKHSFQKLQYIILILNETQCCINPLILEVLSNRYIQSKIFLVIENSDNRDIQEKITFFKTYNKSINIIEVYHSSNKESNKLIKDKIYSYLNHTQEANTLWKENWITLRDEIEGDNYPNINHDTFQKVADKYSLSLEVREDIFNYLKSVGSIN